jgi:ligand-binding SRPBCC domain-containing protein
VAWVTGENWAMEQGIDALKKFELFSDSAQTEPFDFTGWDVNATVSDEKGRNVWTVTVETEPADGVVRLLFPEALVNALRVNGAYRYDALMVPPGADLADDHYLATGPVTVALRTSRRDDE